MTLSVEDQATIINCYKEKGWRGCEICRQFKSKNWSQATIDRCIRRFEERNSFKRKPGSGRPRKVSEEKENELLKLTESQESAPGTSISLRLASKRLKMSASTGTRISKRFHRKSVRRIDVPQITEGAKLRRFKRSKNLYTRFKNEKVKLLAWQDEKDFTLQVPKNRQNNRIFIRGIKNNVNPVRLYHPANKMSKKIMVSCLLSWNGVSKPFFVNPQKTKVNGKRFTRHLKKDLIPALRALYPNGDGIYVQDGASSHTSKLAQNFLSKELGRFRFVNKSQWPPKSPDLNPLDYFFWDSLSRRVYEGRREPFATIEQLKRRIKRVWKDAANDDQVKKSVLQFKKRLRAVIVTHGGPIVHKFR